MERLGTVSPAAGGVGRGQRFVHDPADGADAASALGAAAEAPIDLTGGPRRFCPGERRADVVVGQHVAGTNDHRGAVGGSLVAHATIYGRRKPISIKKRFFLDILSCWEFRHSMAPRIHALLPTKRRQATAIGTDRGSDAG